MAILIEGMDMPKSGFRQVFIFDDGRVYDGNHVDICNPAGTAVEVPPHGDLIDRDELNYSFDASDFDGEPNDNAYNAVRIVDSTPVVIPSDKEDVK